MSVVEGLKLEGEGGISAGQARLPQAQHRLTVR